MKEAIQEILKFLERNVPWLLMGYWLGNRQGAELRKENTTLRLELDVKNDAEKIRAHNAALSDADLKAELLKR